MYEYNIYNLKGTAAKDFWSLFCLPRKTLNCLEEPLLVFCLFDFIQLFQFMKRFIPKRIEFT